MEDKQIIDLIQDLESVGQAPTTEEMLKALKEEYEEKENRIITLKKHVWENSNVKKTMPLEELKEVLKEICRIRDEVTEKRNTWKTKFMREGQEKINSLIPILGMEEEVYWKGGIRKATLKKWYTEANQALKEESERKTADSFWSNLNDAISNVNDRIDEVKKIEEEKKTKSKLQDELQWCRAKLIESGKITDKIAEHMSATSIIELAHAVLKEEYAKENAIEGGKCYCDSHDGSRHYHFPESYWDGTKVAVYESSETY